MTNILIQSPFDFITDTTGRPLANGYIYIGEPGKDPESFPLPVTFDADGAVSAPTPLRTNMAGYPSDGAGTPKRIFTTGPYSIRVRDSNGVQVFYSPDSSDGFFGVVAADLAAGTGALLVGYRSTNVYDKLTKLAISPQDFGAVADGVNNDQAAFEQAAAIGVPVFLPAGEYNAPTGDFSGQTFYSFGGASVNNPTVSVTDVTANAFPVGAVMSFPCTPENLPSGFIPLDGSLLNREVYSALWTFANGSGNIVADASWSSSKMAFSTGNGTSTFRVPDARGLTQAAADNGALVDTDFVLGDVVERVVTDGTEPATTTFRFGIQTVAIRAFSGAVNPGLIDVTALGNQVNDIQTDLLALEAKSFGIDQSWADVTASRAESVTYTNSTNKPIQVSVTCQVQSAAVMELYVDGVLVGQVGETAANAPRGILFAVIPIGSEYEVVQLSGGGVTGILFWAECR